MKFSLSPLLENKSVPEGGSLCRVKVHGTESSSGLAEIITAVSESSLLWATESMFMP